MKQFILICSIFVSLFARADLLDRMKLEESFKNRIEEAFRLYDPQARAVLKFDYRNFNGALPGIADESREIEVTPRSIEPSDIQKLSVEVYSRLDEVSPDIKAYIQKVIPLDKSKVTIEYKKLEPFKEKDFPTPLDSNSFSTILREVLQSFAKFMTIALAVLCVIGLGFLYVQDSRKLKAFKAQIQVISASMAEREPPPLPLQALQNNTNTRGNKNAASGAESSSLKQQDLKFLKEIFADCYWSREDGYAHWLWKNISSSQKAELLAQFPLMKDYSLYFVENEALELSYHEHPYYLEPMGMLLTSQEDLASEVRKDFSTWHFLSPMRQQNLPLTLEERLKAVQTKPDGKRPQFSDKKQSPLRTLEAKLSWGDLSSEDERLLYNQPDMVPVALRENIRSLVWLAQKEDAYIQKVLSRYDARSLASAWVGPEEVLKKLETQLPEKKMKLLLTYKDKMVPTRDSDVYSSLVAEGLRNEAA